jgi:hypothetical protein
MQMPANNSHIHTFCGMFFEVAVWRGVEPKDYEVLIRSNPGGGVTVFKGVIECSGEHLRELEKLSALARMLIQHLETGMGFACWTDQPSRN